MKPHGGIILGRHNGKVLIDRSGEHVLVIGPTRCGKGISVIMPTLLDGWYGSAVIHDPKGELWEKTSGHRSKFGHCLKFDPTDMKSVRINLFDMVDPDTCVADVQNFIEILTDGMIVNHWTMAAQELLTSAWLHLAWHAPTDQKNFGGLRRLIQKGDFGLMEIVKANANDVAVRIAESLLNCAGYKDEKGEHELSTEEEKSNYRQSVYASASVLLKLFDDPVMDHLSSSTEVSFSQLVCGEYPVSLYLSIPDDDAPRVRPYIKALVVGIRRALMKYELTDRYGELKQHRLLFCMDEFLDFKIKDLAEAMTKAASYQMTMLLVTQGFELMENQEADKGAGIRKNASTWVMYRPNDDVEAYRIEKMLGSVPVVEEAESHSSERMSLGWSRKSVSTREVEKTILPASALLKWPKRKWAIIWGHGKPIRAEVIRYHEERRFASKVLPETPMRNFETGALGDPPSETFVSPWFDKVGAPVVIERKPKEKKVVGEKAKTKTKPVDPVKQAAQQNQMVLVGIPTTNPPSPPSRVIT